MLEEAFLSLDPVSGSANWLLSELDTATDTGGEFDMTLFFVDVKPFLLLLEGGDKALYNDNNKLLFNFKLWLIYLFIICIQIAIYVEDY